MLTNYPMQCQCGTQITIQLEGSAKYLRVYCHRCKRVLFEQTEKKSTTDRIENPGLKKIDNRYALLKSLGGGAMGKVYLALDEQTQEKVAIKILTVASNKTMVDYFLREAQLLMQLKHPNIVGLKGVGNYQGFPYLIMEYVSGKSLKELVSKGPLSPRHAVQVIYHLLEALEYAQNFNFIHRDIKPENILLESQNGFVKLIDVGLGKILGEANLTKTGDVMGTLFYMPPEQIRDSKHVDHRSDIYAVGATLYHLVSGHVPYGEFQNRRLDLFRAKGQSGLMPLRQKYPDLPEQLYQIVEKAMAHRPEDRYQTATEMKQAIFEFWSALQETNPSKET